MTSHDGGYEDGNDDDENGDDDDENGDDKRAHFILPGLDTCLRLIPSIQSFANAKIQSNDYKDNYGKITVLTSGDNDHGVGVQGARR